MRTQKNDSSCSARAVVLAGGEGTRMRSPLPKVLHTLHGVSLVGHVLHALSEAGIERISVIVGFKAAAVTAHLAQWPGVATFLQAAPRGSADALVSAGDFLDTPGPVLVLAGDAPCISARTIRAFLRAHRAAGAKLTVLVARMTDPRGYGRIVRDAAGAVAGIVEEKDATDEQRRITEVNSGMYCFQYSRLRQLLAAITPNNAKGEYYLTDAVALLRAAGERVAAYVAPDAAEVAGVNTCEELRRAEQQMRDKKGYTRNG